MFCPRCSESQANDEAQFCSKCGFSIKAVKQLVDADGKINIEDELSPRQKGIRQGAKLILLSLILLPALVLLSALFPGNDRLVESSPDSTIFDQVGLVIIWTLFLAGAARIAYAFAFEKSASVVIIKANAEFPSEEPASFQPNEARQALPPSQSVPASSYGKWKQTTRELFEIPRAEKKTSGELR
jgi:hypothetical protein